MIQLFKNQYILYFEDGADDERDDDHDKANPLQHKNGAAVGCPPIRPIYIPNRPNHFDRVFPNSGISLPQVYMVSCPMKSKKVYNQNVVLVWNVIMQSNNYQSQNVSQQLYSKKGNNTYILNIPTILEWNANKAIFTHRSLHANSVVDMVLVLYLMEIKGRKSAQKWQAYQFLGGSPSMRRKFYTYIILPIPIVGYLYVISQYIRDIRDL